MRSWLSTVVSTLIRMPRKAKFAEGVAAHGRFVHLKSYCNWRVRTGKARQFGTFTWGSEFPLVVRPLADRLASLFRGVIVLEVKFSGRHRIKGDKDLVELGSRTAVMALERSTILESDLRLACGQSTKDLVGTGDAGYARRKGRLVLVPKPRLPGHGLYVDASSVRGVGLFVWNDLLFCTGEFKRIVEEFPATNVHFEEVGEAVARRR